MTTWQDSINVVPPNVLKVTITLAVRTVASKVYDARLRRLRYPPKNVMARLFSLWCHKQGYFYSRTEPLCAVRSSVEYCPVSGTKLHHFSASYGVVV